MRGRGGGAEETHKKGGQERKKMNEGEEREHSQTRAFACKHKTHYWLTQADLFPSL
jgi:hypothetical protein